MKNYVYNLLMALDEDGNVVVIGLVVVFLKMFGINFTVPAAGNAHYTISQVLSEMRQRNMRIGCIGCKILTFLQYLIIRTWDWITMHDFVDPGDHCTNAMKAVPQSEDVG